MAPRKQRTRRTQAELMVRMPPAMKQWLEGQAHRSFSSQNALIVDAIAQKMKREQQQAERA